MIRTDAPLLLEIRDLTARIDERTLLKGINLTVRAGEVDRKSTRLNSSHIQKSRMPSSA